MLLVGHDENLYRSVVCMRTNIYIYVSEHIYHMLCISHLSHSCHYLLIFHYHHILRCVIEWKLLSILNYIVNILILFSYCKLEGIQSGSVHGTSQWLAYQHLVIKLPQFCYCIHLSFVGECFVLVFLTACSLIFIEATCV
jgi:hypothetical protein